MPRSRSLHRRLLLAMLWVVRYPKLVLVGALAALLACIIFANLKLGLSTNQDELFSSRVAFFKDYINFTQNFPENQASYVLIEPADPAHPPAVDRWVAFAESMTDGLRKDTANVKAVDSHVPLEELGTQGILFESPAQVKQDFTDFEFLSVPFRPTNFLNRRFGSVPLERFLNSLEPTGFASRPLNAQTADFTILIANGLTAALTTPSDPIKLGNQVPDLSKLAVTDPSKLGYYYVENKESPGQHLMLVRVYEHDDFAKRNGLADAIDGIRSDIAQISKSFPDFQVHLTGRPALEADEMSTTDHDARTSEIAALTAVFIGLVLLLRSLWVAVAAELALLTGIGWTFGWATVSVHRMNLLSMVFLIALTGIGMDYLIQVLTRYRRESARRSSPRGIWTGVFKHVAAPINTACLGAAGAFFVSIFTNFRGAAELGIVAGGGLLLCLLTGYLVLPPLLTLFPAKPRTMDAEHHDASLHAPLHDPMLKRSRFRNLWLAPPVVWAILLLIGIPFAHRAKFDPGLLNMQSQSLDSVKQVAKLQTWSAAVLTTTSLEPGDQVGQLRKVRDAVQHLTTVESTDSILTAYDNADWLRQQQAGEMARVDYEPVSTQNIPAIANAARKLALSARSAKPPLINMAHALESLDRALSTIDSSDAAARLTAWQQVFIQQLKDLLAPFRPPLFNSTKNASVAAIPSGRS